MVLFFLLFQPLAKSRKLDDDTRCRPRQSFASNTYTFPERTKSPTCKTWLLAEKASNSSATDSHLGGYKPDCFEFTNAKSSDQQSGKVTAVCETYAQCVSVINDHDKRKSVGTAV